MLRSFDEIGISKGILDLIIISYKLTMNVSVIYQEYIQYPVDYTFNSTIVMGLFPDWELFHGLMNVIRWNVFERQTLQKLNPNRYISEQNINFLKQAAKFDH